MKQRKHRTIGSGDRILGGMYLLQTNRTILLVRLGYRNQDWQKMVWCFLSNHTK